MSELPKPVKSGVVGRRSILIASAVLLAVITFLVYFPTLHSDFVYWDDPQYVYDNLNIRVLDISFVKWALTAVVVSNWHPLTLFSHAIDYRLWGLNPMGHHLTSILFHSLNTALFFFLAVKLIELGSRGARGFVSYTLINPAVLIAAAMAALLFGIHPVHVESVSWISERKDVLSALFFMLCIYFYLNYVGARGGKRRRARRYYVGALLTCVLALMSKPMAVSLPLVLLILDYYPLERFPGTAGWSSGLRRVLPEKVPFILLAGASSVATLWAQKSGGAIESFDFMPLSVRIPISFSSYLFYLYKLIIPQGLAPLYIHPFKASIFSVEYLLPLVLFCLITLATVVLYKRWKIFLVVWCYYVLTLFPVIGIVQVGSQAAADRYTYLPGLAPTLLVAILFGLFFERCKRKTLRRAVVSIGIVVLLVFGVLTVKQELVWKSTLSLWARQVEIYPSANSYTSRGEAYRREGKYQEAVQDYTAAIKVATGSRTLGEVYHNRGSVLQKLGAVDEALWDFRMALKINPRNIKTYNNRGNIYRSTGRYALAIEDLSKAIAIDPSLPVLHFNLGLAYAGAGRRAEALGELRTASRMGMSEADGAIKSLGLGQ